MSSSRTIPQQKQTTQAQTQTPAQTPASAQAQVQAVSVPAMPLMQESPLATTTIVVLGASGDLAHKKTYPALFGLFQQNPEAQAAALIVGYARTRFDSIDEFRARVRMHLRATPREHNGDGKSTIDAFLACCYYVPGSYDDGADFHRLEAELNTLETKHRSTASGTRGRVYYLALPPTVFLPCARLLSIHCNGNGNKDKVSSDSPIWTRLVVEKPFGRDLESCRDLLSSLSAHWPECKVFRIDHYLGKDMVKNILPLRFHNTMFQNIWSAKYIKSVQITFKEQIGTDGRGGYFDEFGIIRDVVQNHLIQVLALVAMEPPVSMAAEHVRDAKVHVLKHTVLPDCSASHVLLGQYTGTNVLPGYTDDKTVPAGSQTPTFAAMCLRVETPRWHGVNFIVSAGKALDESKVEVRIVLSTAPESNTKQEQEIVIRVQPDPSVYAKIVTRVPGLHDELALAALEMPMAARFPASPAADAYEALLLDVIQGNQANFVRADELEAAWTIVSPIIGAQSSSSSTSSSATVPEPYVRGTQGPSRLDDFLRKHGISPNSNA